MPALVCFILGTRAQLVKMAPVLLCAKREGLPIRVWFSGQHGESMDGLLSDFGIVPDDSYSGAFGERDSVSSLVAWLPTAFRDCMGFLKRAERDSGSKPLVVVHGDTLSALLGAVAAKLVRATVAHVESGLTSGSIATPFPEELIRRIIFRMSDIAYCPNAGAQQVMSRFRQMRVVNTFGNTIVDSLRLALGRGKQNGVGESGELAVFSIHRFENIYSRKRLKVIVGWILEAASRHDVIFVLHPATVKRLADGGWLQLLGQTPRVTLSPRMPYTSFVELLERASVVVSDGGSNQEELACLGVPTVLLRNRSERPDGLGANAILEGELGCPVGKYLVDGRYRALRVQSSLDGDCSPSQLVVADLDQYVRSRS